MTASVSETGQPPPKDKEKKPPDIEKQQNPLTAPGQVTGNLAWAGSRVLGGAPNSRTFEQIIEDEKKNRNIIEIQLQKQAPTEDSLAPRPLTYDDLGELIFDIIKIPHEECITFDFNTGRPDVKQLQLKPSVNADQYVTSIPNQFKGHEVSVFKQLNNITRMFI